MKTGRTDPARLVALQVLRAIRAGRKWDEAWEKSPLVAGSRDRRFAHELAGGVLRLRNRLDFALQPHVNRPLDALEPDVRDVLRLGAYQLLETDRVGVPAAVHTSVELAKRDCSRAKGLVNAVLRQMAAAPTPVYPDAERDPLAFLVHYESHPEWIAARWLARFGGAASRALCAYNNQRPDTCLRINPRRTSRDAVLARLPGSRAGKLSSVAVRSPGPGYQTLQRELAAGQVSVQDEGAIRVGDFCGAKPGQVWLDLAAAPGGKACHLAEQVGATGRVLAFDRSESKVERIRDNAARLGLTWLAAAVGDARELVLEAHDGVLLDAPCSGLGVLGRRPDARWRKRLEDLTRLPKLQLELLDAAARFVKPGGTLVYSVCSFEPEETEAVAARFAATHPDFKPLAESLPNSAGVLYLLPHERGVDGAFAARWRRHG